MCKTKACMSFVKLWLTHAVGTFSFHLIQVHKLL